MLRVVVDDVPVREDLAAGLDEIVREGARRMLAAALEAEVEAYVAAFVDQLDERGRRLVVRNGACPAAAGDHSGRRGGGGRAAGQ